MTIYCLSHVDKSTQLLTDMKLSTACIHKALRQWNSLLFSGELFDVDAMSNQSFVQN